MGKATPLEDTMKLRYIAALAALGLIAAAVAGVGRPDNGRGKAPQPKGEITVSGTGTVTRAPDRAELDFSVVSRSDVAKQALAANSTDATKIIAALKQAGVDAKDIRTEDVSLEPDYSENGNDIVGYTARNSVHVSTGIGDAGSVIDAATAAGANEVDGPTLSVSDRAQLYNEALKNAVDRARSKAEAIAAASGVHVGAVTSVQENETGQMQGPYPVAMAAKAMSAPIEPGTQDIQANVTVTFAIG